MLNLPLLFLAMLLFSQEIVSNSAAPWTAACQAPLSSTISRNVLRFMSFESVMLSISSSAALFFCSQSFPVTGSFPKS